MRHASALLFFVALGASPPLLPRAAQAQVAPLGASEQPLDASEENTAAETAASEAAPSQPLNVELARAHFQRGVQLYHSGAYDAAFAEFSRAHESAPHYRILYNLAQVQAQRHDYVEALTLFERYLAQAGGNVPESRAQQVRAEMLELGQRISRLWVETNVDDVRLFIGDLPVIELPRDEPILLNAGIHRLRVEKTGYISASRRVTLVGGEESRLSVDLLAELEMDELPPPAPPLPPAPAPPPEIDRTALWASLALAGAFTGATLTFGLLTREANASLGERLTRYPAPRGAIESGRDRVRTFALLTDSFALAAASAFGLSTYLYFSDAGEPSDAAPANGLRAQLGPRGPSLSWVGAF